MSKFRRLQEVLIALLTILSAAAMASFPDVGYYVMLLFLVASLTLAGLERIVFYFRMARHMVGGVSVLYTGVILYDLGLLTGSVSMIPSTYVMLYLFVMHLFSGVVTIMRAREAKQLDASSWKLTLAQGIANVMVALLCIAFARSMRTAVYLYCAGLVYSSCLRIATALRRQAIVYIQ